MHGELLDLEDLPHKFLSALDESQGAALKEALDQRTQSLRQWVQQHEDVAIQMWPQGEATADCDVAEELLDLENEAFSRALAGLEDKKAAYLKRCQTKAVWRCKEKQLLEQQGATPIRRLRGPPTGAQPVMMIAASLRIDFGVNQTGQKENQHIVGSPALLKTSGVLYYEVVIESAVPDAGYVFGKTSFGFAGREFEYSVGDDDQDRQYDSEACLGQRRTSEALSEPVESWTAHHGTDLVVGGMYGFAANIDLGQIAFCKAGDWTDPDSRVLVVDSGICSGVFPALAAPYGKLIFRPPCECISSQPDASFWDRKRQFAAAFRAGDDAVARALATEEQEHAQLEFIQTGSKELHEDVKALTNLSPPELAQHSARLIAIELGGEVGVEPPHFAVQTLAGQALSKLPQDVLAEHAGLITSRLTHNESGARQRALVRLVALEPPMLRPHVSQILDRLRDSDAGIRAAAVEAFCRLDEQAQQTHVPTIINLIKLPEPHMRHAALKALDASLATVELGVVVRSLGDSAGSVRMAALEIIKKLPSSKVGKHVAAIVDHLQSKEIAVQRDTLAALAVLDAAVLAPHALTPILELIGGAECDNEARIAAFAVLQRLEPADLEEHLSPERTLIWLKHAESSFREATLKLMATKLDPSRLGSQANCVIASAQDEDPDVGKAAVSALAVLELRHLTEEQVQSLIGLLAHREAHVRRRAIGALCRFGPSLSAQATPLLRLLDDSRSAPRRAVLDVMASAFDQDALAECADGWARCLDDGNSSVRSAVLDLLAKLQPAAVAPFAMRAMAQFLRMPTKVANVLAKLPPEALKLHAVTLGKLATHEDATVRQCVLNSLSRLSPDALEKYAAAIIESLEDDEQKVREAAESALGKLEPGTLQQHGEALTRRLEHTKPAIRVAALGALAKLPPAALKAHAGELVKCFEDANEDGRSKALQAFRRLRPADRALHVAAILEMLGHTDKYVRGKAREAIALCSGSAGRAALAEHAHMVASLLDCADSEVQESALRGLAELQPAVVTQFLPRVLAFFPGGEANVRAASLSFMSRLMPSSLEPQAALVVRSLDDDAPPVRAAALDALRAFRPAARNQQLELLLPMIARPSAVQRCAGFNALTTLEPSVLSAHCVHVMKALGEEVSTEALASAQRLLCKPGLLRSLERSVLTQLLVELSGVLVKDTKGRANAIQMIQHCGHWAMAEQLEAALGKLLEDPSIARQVLSTMFPGSANFWESYSPPPNGYTLVRVHGHHLVKLCENESYYMRLVAIRALGSAGRASSQYASLFIKKLDDVDEDVRASTLEALARLGDAELGKYMTIILQRLEDAHPRTRRAAVRLLGSVGLPTFRPLLPKLIERLREDEDGDVHQLVVTTITKQLGSAGLEANASALIPLLGRAVQPEAQVSALKLLAKVEPAALRGLLGPVVSLLERESTPENVASAAITTIATAGFGEHAELIVKQLESKDSRRDVALKAMCKMEANVLARHSDAVMKLLQEPGSKSDEVVKTMSKLRPEYIVTAITSLLTNSDPFTRRAALRVAAKLERAALHPMKAPIIKCLEDREESVVAAAFEACAAFEPSELVELGPRIVEAIEDVSDGEIVPAALAAVAALERCPESFCSHLTTLSIHIAAEGEDNCRLAALKALASLSRTELSFCTSLLLPFLEMGDATAQMLHPWRKRLIPSAVLVLGTLCGFTLVVPTNPTEDD